MIHNRTLATLFMLFMALLPGPVSAQIGADALPGQDAESATPSAADAEEQITPDSPPAVETTEVIGFRSIPLFPNQPELPARQALRVGDPELAVELARQFLEENPQDIQARLVLAEALDPMFYRREILRLYEDAHKLAEEAPDQQPAALEPFLDMKLGLIYQNMDQNDKAEPFLRKAAEDYQLYSDTLNGRIFNALGHVFEAQDRQEEANLAFKTAAEKFGSEAAKAHLEHQNLRRQIRGLGL